RRFIAELLTARGYEVVHLLAPGRAEPHRPLDEAEYRQGRLYLCGQLVA
ncbi:MAG: DNA repair protein, partial [Thermoleophilia bacterium]